MREVTIGELSRLTKVNIETIRYYEKIGIMPNPPRNSSGYRIYSTPHLERLSFVRRSRELGFSQPEASLGLFWLRRAVLSRWFSSVWELVVHGLVI